VLFEQPSPFGQVLVVETAERRCLKFSRTGGDQSCLDRRDPKRVVHEYIRVLPVGLLFTPSPPRTLMVGLGGGRAVQLLRDHDPQMELDVVEINPVVVEVAQKYFDIEPSERLRIHVADGRAFFDGRDGVWDMVVLDAFGNDFIPFHLTTVEFLRIVAERVTAEGAVVANLWSRNDRLFRAMIKTYTQVFSRVYIFRALHVGNAILVAIPREDPKSCAAVQQLAAARAAKMRFSFPFTDQPGRCEPSDSLDLTDVPVLSDHHRAEFDAMGPL
jgi:spermidine synthase